MRCAENDDGVEAGVPKGAFESVAMFHLAVPQMVFDEVRRLLETTDLSIDRIAADCGLGSPVTLRQNFAAAFSTTPTDYRRRFHTSGETG